MIMKNEKEALELMERYETITLEEILKEWYVNGDLTALGITGYGKFAYCTLCVSCGVHSRSYMEKCCNCFWEIITGDLCTKESNSKTYTRIEDATTPLKLRNAFRARAKYMRKIHNEWKQTKGENS